MNKEQFTVGQFLQYEIQNLKDAEATLSKIDPEAMKTVEECAELLVAVKDDFGLVARAGENSTHFKNFSLKHKIPPNLASELLTSATLIGPQPDEATSAKQELNQASADLICAMLLLRVWRGYLHGVADMLKNRINAGLGSLRVQAETLALIRLAHDEPEVAFEWIGAGLGQSGRTFYNRYHTKLVDLVRDFGLKKFHDIGSTVAMHSRPDGIASSMLVAGGLEIVNSGIEISMTTVDTTDAGEFYLNLCYFLRFYDRAMVRLPSMVPELNGNEELKSKVTAFSRSVRKRWATLNKKFPELANKGKKGGAF